MTSSAPLIKCEICKREEHQDSIMKHACVRCGAKFRNIDNEAADVSKIRREMRLMGIPVGSQKSKRSRG